MKWHINPSKLATYNKFVVRRHYFADGALNTEVFSFNGNKHRIGGWAVIVYEGDKANTIHYTAEWVNGKLIRNKFW